MSNPSVAPVKWEMGQALLPAHLTEQENFHLSDSALRNFAKGRAPQYGLTQLAWDEALLRTGNVNIERFQLVLPSHQRVVDYPGNAHVVSGPIVLGELQEPAVYFFVLEELEAGVDPNQLINQTSHKVVHRYFKLVFSSTRHFPAEMEHLLADHDIEYQGCLAVFKQDDQGGWGVTDQYIPPLMQVGNSPYLRASLNRLRAQLQHCRGGLQSSYTGEPLLHKQYVNVINCVRSVQSVLFTLKNLSFSDSQPGEISPHPYDLYEDLYRLYLDLSLYRDVWPSGDALPYRHQQIHVVFRHLLQNISALLASDNAQDRSSQFVLKEGVMTTSLPEQAVNTDLLYFIVKLHEQPSLRVSNLPKVSCLNRLNMMHDYSLSGLGLTEVEESTLNFSFGSNIQCFQIEKDQELAYLFTENSAAFYDHTHLKGREYFIYAQPG